MSEYARRIHWRWGHPTLRETNKRISQGRFSSEFSDALRHAAQTCQDCSDTKLPAQRGMSSYGAAEDFNDFIQGDVGFLTHANIPVLKLYDCATSYT